MSDATTTTTTTTPMDAIDSAFFHFRHMMPAAAWDQPVPVLRGEATPWKQTTVGEVTRCSLCGGAYRHANPVETYLCPSCWQPTKPLYDPDVLRRELGRDAGDTFPARGAAQRMQRAMQLARHTACIRFMFKASERVIAEYLATRTLDASHELWESEEWDSAIMRQTILERAEFMRAVCGTHVYARVRPAVDAALRGHGTSTARLLSRDDMPEETMLLYLETATQLMESDRVPPFSYTTSELCAVRGIAHVHQLSQPLQVPLAKRTLALADRADIREHLHNSLFQAGLPLDPSHLGDHTDEYALQLEHMGHVRTRHPAIRCLK